MRYVEKHLRLNEHVIDRAKVSWTVMAAAIIRAVLFLLAGYGVWRGLKDPVDLNLSQIAAFLSVEFPASMAPDGTDLIITLKQPKLILFMGIWGGLILCQLIYRILSINAVELAVTDKKIVGKTGIIRSKSVDAFLDRIDHFTIHESLLGRIFNYAMIEIGTTSSRIRFPYISNASDFRNIVMDCIDKKKYIEMSAQANLITNDAKNRQPGSNHPEIPVR